MSKICFQCGYIIKYQYTPTKDWIKAKCIQCKRITEVTELIVFNLSLRELQYARPELSESKNSKDVIKKQPQPVTETVES